MKRRISFGLFSFTFALACAGCVSTNAKDASPTAASNGEVVEVPANAKIVKSDGGPKRSAQAKTEIAYGAMKETEAESDAIKKIPEAQARLRDDARRAYQAAILQDPNNLEAHRNLARLYTKVGDYERAFATYKKAMAAHPKDASLWYDLGLCHHRRKELGESVKCFQKALAIDPENREYMKKLGFTLAYIGQTEQGLAMLTRAQGAALAHYGIARVLVQKDQVSLAQHHLRLALRENGQLEDARELLASLSQPNAAAPSAVADQNRGIGGPQAARE